MRIEGTGYLSREEVLLRVLGCPDKFQQILDGSYDGIDELGMIRRVCKKVGEGRGGSQLYGCGLSGSDE